MNVIDAKDLFGEESEVVLFGEAGQLRNIIQASIYDPCEARLLQFAKELFRILFRETYCVEFHDAAASALRISSS